MTVEEAISYIRKAKISPEISGHLIYIDDGSIAGISTSASSTDPSNYSVKYSRIDIFDNVEISNVDGVVNLTRAYTNPLNGVQSIAFLNNVKVLDDETGKLRQGLIIRVVPVSRLEQKLIFLNGEYENVEISLIDWDGDYMIHGKSLKNSNFFEYFKSYNPMSPQEFNRVVDTIHTEVGSMHIRNSKNEDSVIAYTPLSGLDSWFLVAYIPAKELVANRSIDWILLGIVSFGLVVLLHFNLAILHNFNRKLTVAAEAANQANEAKSYFLSTMSHDIRTPMNAIIGMNEMILRDSQDKSILKYSENIRAAGYESPVMGANTATTPGIGYAFAYPMSAKNVKADRSMESALNNLEPSAGEAMRPSLTRLKEFVDYGCIDIEKCTAEIEDDYNAVIMRFFERDVPMMLCSGDVVSGTKKRESTSEAFSEKPFKYDCYVAPSGDEGGYYRDTMSILFCANKNSESLDMTNEFIRFLTSGDELGLMAQEKRLITPTKDYTLDEVYASLSDVPEERIVNFRDIEILDTAVKEFRTAAHAVINGEMTVDEAVESYGTITH